MIHRANADFWNDYRALAVDIRARADKQFALLKNNPHHPSLQFKKLGDRNGQEIWSARVTLKYRAMAVRCRIEALRKPSAFLTHGSILCQTGSFEAKDLLMIIQEKITELQRKGFCILRAHLPTPLINACREAFWPILLGYLESRSEEPNRGPHRHFMPMPFEPPCFTPEFFFDAGVLSIVRGAMEDRVVADQWGCDVPLLGSQNQEAHVDYQRPLFAEAPDLLLPLYMLVVSFGLISITTAHGPIEIAPGTHRMRREEALRAVKSGEIEMQSVPLEIGDVLVRHPWGLHRGTPNTTDTPRALATVRYVRWWYADNSREINSIPRGVWQSLSREQQGLMRFPIGD